MKNLLKMFGGGLVFLVIIVAAMAILDICPPQGPWPQPPWCPGSSIPWPFSNPSGISSTGVDTNTTPGEDSQSASEEDSQADAKDDSLILDEMSDNERLARVAIGLMSDLTTVNTYFNDAASSMGEVQLPGDTDGNSTSTGSSSQEEASGQIPAGFMDVLPESGYIPAPEGACAVGASPSASFLNQKGEKITPDLLAEKNIQVIGFNELTGGSIDGRKLEGTLTSLIPTGDPDLLTSAGWNQKVWSQMAEIQTPAASLMDYHLWTASEQIEASVVESIETRINSMGLPPQVINAVRGSQTSGWYAGPSSDETDKISAMEIEAVFSGKTEGTIYETRDFSIPGLGEMPEFGPMTGEGSVVYHDPDFGDYPFDLEIDWTKWDQLGRVTEGDIVFTDQEHDVVIEMSVLEDNSRSANVLRGDELVGIVNVDSSGMISYEDLTE